MQFAEPMQVIRREAAWLSLILVTSIIALAANFFGLLLDISIVLPHLFYLPIIITAYRFPKQGVAFSIFLSLLYLLMLLPAYGEDTLLLVSGASRAIVFIGIGWVISVLSVHLTEQRERYRGLFDNAEAGAAVVRVEGNDFIIEEANYRLAQTLKTTEQDLWGRSLVSFWDDDAGRDRFASRVRQDGAGYAHEARWKRADGGPVDVLISAGKIAPATSVITVIDITEQKNTEAALKNANAELHILSRLTRNDLMRRVEGIAGILDKEKKQPGGNRAQPGLIALLDASIHALLRRLELAASFQDLGTEPPAWQPVQEIIRSVLFRTMNPAVSVRPWTERLEIFADKHLDEVFFNLIDNACRYGETTTEIVITYHIVPDGVEIIVEDDGRGIPLSDKESLFEYGSMTHGGFGLFVNRQILGVTGITLRENGEPGRGARFVMHVPRERCRIV